MSRTIQIKRGLKADLPALAVGELGFTIDTHEVFIGSAAGNVPVESKESSELLVQLESDGAAMQSNITQLNNEVLAMSRGLGQSISSLALLNSTYPAGDTKDHIVAGNVKEVATLTVTAIPSVSSNVTVTLDGVAHTLLANPLIHITTAALASAIRSEVFAGWVTGGTGNVVTFESTTVGPKGSHSFSGGTSGAAGSMVTTTEGEAANFHRYFWSGTAWLDGGVDFFTQEYKEAIEAQVLADFTAAENARQADYAAAEAIRQAEYLQASDEAAANQELYEGLLEEGVLQTSINTKLAALELEYAPELATLQQSDVTMSQQLADTLNKSAITLTHMFADNTARDAYFVAHPAELIELQFIKVGTTYQQYIEGVWTGSVPIVSEQLSASNQPIVDTGNYFTTDNTNEALQELGAHKVSTANPHGVTKAQVGLGNVDNTSDANKPISTAGQTALNLKANKAQEAWITPTLLSGWINFDSATYPSCAYMKDEMGFVRLKGMVKGGTIGSNVFALPPGYRPLKTTYFTADSSNAWGQCIVSLGGTVVAHMGGATWFGLDNITFRAET